MGQKTSKKHAKIIILGLDYAGKTSILYRMKHNPHRKTNNSLHPSVPTVGFNAEVVKYTVGNTKVVFTMFDIGALFFKTKQLAKHYLEENQAIVFVIDSCCRDRLAEVRETMHRALENILVQNCKLLVFANKQDIAGACTCEEMTELLNLKAIKQEWKIQPCSAKDGSGIYEGLAWLSQVI